MASWVRPSSARPSESVCGDTEWTLACEADRQPYPYGDSCVRDDHACNVDKPYIVPDPERVVDPRMQAQSWRSSTSEPSGLPNVVCVAPMASRHDGNVDEWVERVPAGSRI
jgi:hypothetical protein